MLALFRVKTPRQQSKSIWELYQRAVDAHALMQKLFEEVCHSPCVTKRAISELLRG